MKGREGKRAPPTDLLVCFPTRAHLTLMPKPICSPARPFDQSKRHNHHQSNHHNHQQQQNHHHHQRQLKLSRSNNKGGQASPLLWAKTKPMGADISEPTSPKVTCAGQIKVNKSKPNSCKNWQSVMEEIERLHNNKKHKKRPSWMESIGFKKDVMQFLTCLRGLRFDFQCFGTFHASVISSDDEEEEEEEEEVEEEDHYQYEQDEEHHQQVGIDDGDSSGSSRAVFSKWFMVLEENQENEFVKENKDEEESSGPSVPPSNALLLMRCRSAPAKSWLEEKQEQQQEEEIKQKLVLEEEKQRKDSLILKCYAPEFFKLSSDIAKETWVVGGTKDPFSRSRSWKR